MSATVSVPSMFLLGTATMDTGNEKRISPPQPDEPFFSGQDLAAICAFKAPTALVEVDVVDWKGAPLSCMDHYHPLST